MIPGGAPVSVVIPCFRCEKTIARAIESVFCQTWRPAEVILVDDASGTHTLDHLLELEKQFPDEWIRVRSLSSNSGPGTARNVGWDLARRRYIAFLDADDAWHEKKIENQLGWMLEHPEITLTGHKYRTLGSTDNEEGGASACDSLSWKPVSARSLLLSNRFATSTVIVKREIKERFVDGKFHSEDYQLWCQILLSGHLASRTSGELGYAFKPSFGAGGLSGDLAQMFRGELDTYKRLLRSQFIGWGMRSFLVVLATAKYLRRVILSWRP